MSNPLGGELGDASITVRGDTSKLEGDIRRGTVKAAEEAEASSEFESAANNLGDHFGKQAGTRAGDGFGNSFIRDANGRLHNAQGGFVTEAKNLGERIGNDIGDETEKTLGSRIANFGKTLAPKWLQTIAAWVLLLGPPVLELVATLAPAVGVVAAIIPAAIGGAAALGVLKAAFNGVGNAIKAMNGPTAALQRRHEEADTERPFVRAGDQEGVSGAACAPAGSRTRSSASSPAW